MKLVNYHLRKSGFAAKLFVLFALTFLIGCQRNVVSTPSVNPPKTLREVPAQRLNFRFEPDVPAPTVNQPTQSDERNAAVQADFDQNRSSEQIDKTLISPDKLRVLVVYHRIGDAPEEFRLDMYAPEGKLIRKITYDGMAAHFAETIVWSPDSSAVAFVAMIRANQNPTPPAAAAATPENQSNANLETNADSETNANSAVSENSANVNADTNANSAAAPPATAPDAPKPVLTFRTEQLYTVNRDGADVKPLTQNEGLIYFYFVWSPDSSALAAMAAMYQEWNYLQFDAEKKGESFNPQGRPRLVEKTGRERILDDNLTSVRPVWSPDSAKIAVAFDKQMRIYDAVGDAPTQAAIPLRNQLLISSKAFDENLQKQEQNTNAVGSTVNASPETTTLPDENSLVSFNPIISLEWTEDSLLYLQTGYIKQMKNETDSARSYLRWHRLIFSPQAAALGN
ncbi:MAG: hypothetical protein M3T96_10190 [Acidobacteriota bacterium]|nr:hypothetical protein [Acidobacteriota bacterium]